MNSVHSGKEWSRKFKETLFLSHLFLVCSSLTRQVDFSCISQHLLILDLLCLAVLRH